MIPLRDNIPTKYFPWIRWMLLLLNAYVFWIELHLHGLDLERFIMHWGVVPKSLLHAPLSQAYTVISSMFLHGGWLHIIFNMLFFFIFADNVEDQLGHLKFLLFYLLTGSIAAVAQAYMAPHSALPLIGASGAIAGVLGAYFFYFPHSRIVTLIPLGFFITIREIPAFFFLGFWFILQMLSGTSRMALQASQGGIAWWAHIVGFMSGILLAPLFAGRKSKYR